MERKQTENAIITAVDEAQGIVEAIWAVMGNIDDGNDIIHTGAFTKTFNERGNQIKLLDNHRASSVMDSLGIVQELKELRGAELPQEILDRYPDATGGAWGKFQFLMETPEGKGAFTRVQKGAVKGWSFGYDAVDKDHSTITKDDQQISVRNLRQIKLYEISPVLFAMNEATTTTDAKSQPSEGKPYGAIQRGEAWLVFKLDEDGQPAGSALGEHDSEAEANAQVRALYAEEDADKAISLSKLVDDVHSAFSDQYNTPNTWDYWAREVFDEYIIACHSGSEGQTFYQISYSRNEEGEITFAPRADWIEGNYLFIAGTSDTEDYEKSTTGPSKSEKTPTSDEAGPPEDEDTRFKNVLLLEAIELEEMEVS